MVLKLKNINNPEHQLIHVETGDIIGFKRPVVAGKPITYLSYSIRKIAKVQFNHVGVVVVVIINRKETALLFEARAGGFMAVDLRNRLIDPEYTQQTIIFRPVYKEFNQDTFINETLKLSGTAYDIRGLLLNQLVLNLADIWLGRKSGEIDKVYCYEAAFYLHRRAKIFRDWYMSKPSVLFKNQADFTITQTFNQLN